MPAWQRCAQFLLRGRVHPWALSCWAALLGAGEKGGLHDHGPVGEAQRSLGLPWTVCLVPAPGQLQTAGRRAAEVGEVP